MGIPYSYFRLKVPMIGNGVLIAIGEAPTGKPTLITGTRIYFTKVNPTEESSGKRKVDIGNVELTTHSVDTEKMSVKAGT